MAIQARRDAADKVIGFTVVVKNKFTGQRRSVGTFTNRREAERAQARAYAEIEKTGRVSSFKNITIGALVELHLEARRASAQPSSIAGYRNYLSHFLNFVGEGLPVVSIDLEMLQSFLTHLVKDLKMAPLTVNLVFQTVGAVLQRGVMYGYLSENVARYVDKKPKRRRKKSMRALSLAEHESLVAAINPHYRTLVTVWPFVGGRPSEMFGLQIRDWDPEKETLRICRQFQKGQWVEWLKHEADPRTLKFDQKTADIIAAHILSRGDVPDDAVIFATPTNKPINQSYFGRVVFKPAVLAAKIEGDISPHSLRHTCATWMLESGSSPMVVAKRLGHSSSQITMQTYASLLKDVDATAPDLFRRWHEGMSEVEAAKRARNNKDVELEPWEVPSNAELAANEETDLERETFNAEFRREALEEAIAGARLGISVQPSTTEVQHTAVGEE